MLNQLTPITIIGIIAAYFLLLILVSLLTSRRADNEDFFLAGRKSPWFLVAFGMIGASLSGVTFISIPGVVGADGANKAFSYLQMVFGYFFGYIVIAQVLMPLYYRMNLTSIYTYLEERLGYYSYKTGAAFFLLSRAIGSSFRLYLVAIVLFHSVFGPMGDMITFAEGDSFLAKLWKYTALGLTSFEGTVAITILLIWVYTFKGGIKTIVWTDTLQTIAMLTAVVLTIIGISQALETDISGMIGMIRSSDYSQVFFFKGGWNDPNNFFKQFISGVLIAIVMTGLDQDMMQKNLSCKNIRDAQKNMYTFSFILIFVNVLFLTLGALLYLYAASIGVHIPEQTDQLYPLIALKHLSPAVGILFIIGLIAAAYSSADSALTALTTSFCVDFLDFQKKEIPEEQKIKQRRIVHVGVSIFIFALIIIFNAINNTAVISQVFVAAGYTYGPILGLFAFGILSPYQVKDKWAWLVCLIAPILSYILNANAANWFWGFQFGFLIIAVNGLLTFLGLWLIAEKQIPTGINPE